MRGWITRGGLGLASQPGGITVINPPGAPIIGAATAGNASATVTFSPPISNGGSAITGYTATSAPGGFTGTGVASPITINGLINGTSYTFSVRATNVAGTGPASAASNAVTPSGSVVLAGAPTNLIMDLQGQTTQNGSGGVTVNNDFIPGSPNFTHMTWTQGSTGTFPITQNRIRRRTVPVTAAGRGAEGVRTVYATVAAATAYSDVSAPNSTGYPAGGGPNYYVGQGYGYTVACVDSQGNEGPESATMVAPYFLGGLQVLNGGDFSGAGMTVVYNNATGPMRPGRTTNVKMTATSAFGDAVVYAGNGSVQWNLNIANYNFINMWVAAGQAGSSLQFAPLRVGDKPINAQGGGQLQIQSSPYATLQNGVYVNIKIPLSTFMTDWTSGSGVQLTSWYKTNFQDASSSTGNVYYIGDWYFSEA